MPPGRAGALEFQSVRIDSHLLTGSPSRLLMIATGNASQTSEHDRELLEKLEDVINGDDRPVLLGREGAHSQFPEPLFHVLTKAVRMMASG